MGGESVCGTVGYHREVRGRDLSGLAGGSGERWRGDGEGAAADGERAAGENRVERGRQDGAADLGREQEEPGDDVGVVGERGEDRRDGIARRGEVRGAGRSEG